jgi:hypothetical protein
MHDAVLLRCWIRGRRARTALVAFLALAGAVALAGSPSRTQEPVDPLLAAATSDPLELARVVDRLGDPAILARITAPDVRADVRLAAIRAAPALCEPERVLEHLAALAAGRDPDLAPAAGLALLQIARRIDPRALDAREVMRSELSPARAALARLAGDPSARADLRRAAALADDALAAAGVPAP